ncbi:hypothetical protein DPMN_128735 [Dreissena polymorpha]|uniref:Uncharacterized protein n=1 Tax=Dreissena polymorpha TaxID=45954 RepID=A0A9D4H1F1_DREPO|nr:hypothetical protein DPMN_128735 [Dreissena polymorpha]
MTMPCMLTTNQTQAFHEGSQHGPQFRQLEEVLIDFVELVVVFVVVVEIGLLYILYWLYSEDVVVVVVALLVVEDEVVLTEVAVDMLVVAVEEVVIELFMPLLKCIALLLTEDSIIDGITSLEYC